MCYFFYLICNILFRQRGFICKAIAGYRTKKLDHSTTRPLDHSTTRTLEHSNTRLIFSAILLLFFPLKTGNSMENTRRTLEHSTHSNILERTRTLGAKCVQTRCTLDTPSLNFRLPRFWVGIEVNRFEIKICHTKSREAYGNLTGE